MLAGTGGTPLVNGMHGCAPLCQAQLTGAEMEMHSQAPIVICSRHCSVQLTAIERCPGSFLAVGRWPLGSICPLAGMRSGPAWLSAYSYSTCQEMHDGRRCRCDMLTTKCSAVLNKPRVRFVRSSAVFARHPPAVYANCASGLCCNHRWRCLLSTVFATSARISMHRGSNVSALL